MNIKGNIIFTLSSIQRQHCFNTNSSLFTNTPILKGDISINMVHICLHLQSAYSSWLANILVVSQTFKVYYGWKHMYIFFFHLAKTSLRCLHSFFLLNNRTFSGNCWHKQAGQSWSFCDVTDCILHSGFQGCSWVPWVLFIFIANASLQPWKKKCAVSVKCVKYMC